ncbi:hypothetical protein AY601_2260 [Pedobacter cryoconitis]|uniref:Uncharacterized protein n=1 Tax=Pedobacter cryoconitis TaxID=188932 RepID=A0A127VCX5_9SPHI|nr:hypothetical protein AY601_2260 [Pedobacter cryoconitis]
MKIILLLSFLFFNTIILEKPKTVYICGNSNTKKYHYKSNCRGLSNCNYRIIKTTLAKMKGKNRTLCKWEK